jgi:hypothetical protein
VDDVKKGRMGLLDDCDRRMDDGQRDLEKMDLGRAL